MTNRIKPTEVYWSFLNEDTEMSTDGLTFQQARFVASVLPRATHPQWLVWHEGLVDWIVLEDCLDLLSEKDQDAKHMPPFPPVRTLKSDPQRTFDKSSTPNKVDLRVNRRFVKKYVVEIAVRGKIFKTATVNISMGGMLLENPLPKSLGKTFNAVLTRSDGATIELFCAQLRSAKGDSEPSRRIRIIGAEHEGLLHSWLIDPRTT